MRILSFILLLLASIVVFVVVDQYLFCPVYSFADTAPFAGDSIYNPYALAAKGQWVKCNFHSHAHCWDGVTYGYGTPDDINRVYNHLHYGVHAVSDYQYVDTTSHLSSNYIGCYEHGYNMLKTHQLVVGVDKVCWKDYLLPQTASNRQDILNRLSAVDTNALLVINHPMVRNGYRKYDLVHLSKYNCMEVLSPSCNSSALWDDALSAGNPVFLAGNDDAHNVLDSNNAGKICNWVNVPETNKENIIKAMKTGCSYAMTIGKPLMQEERHNNNDSMPMLQSFTMKKDLLTAVFNLPANEIKIFGENGSVLDSVKKSGSISYILKEQDSYARVVATYSNGTQILLNPVFRYKGLPLQQSTAGINNAQTLFSRTGGSILLFFWFNFLFAFLFPRKAYQTNLRNKRKISYGYLSISMVSKAYQVWYRGFIRIMYRLFFNLALQRKNRAE